MGAGTHGPFSSWPGRARRGSMLPQSSAPVGLSSAAGALEWRRRSVAGGGCLEDLHARVHREFAGRQHSCRQEWSGGRCVAVAQVRTGHSLLAVACLHHIEHRKKTAKHLVFHCLACSRAERDTWPGDTFTTDPRCLWSYLERIGVVTRPPDQE